MSICRPPSIANFAILTASGPGSEVYQGLRDADFNNSVTDRSVRSREPGGSPVPMQFVPPLRDSSPILRSRVSEAITTGSDD